MHKTHVKNYFKSELSLCHKNLRVCNEQWEQIKETLECESIKNEVEELKISFDTVINRRNQQLSILFHGLEDTKERTDFLVAAKISAVGKLSEIYKSRYHFFNCRHLLQTSELKYQSVNKENEILEVFKKSKEKLDFLISYQGDHEETVLKDLRNKKNETIFERDSENEANVEKLEEELHDTMEWLLIKIQTTLMSYLYQNQSKLKEYETLMHEDINAHKLIACNFDRIENLQVKMIFFKMHWKKLNKDFIKRSKEKKTKLLQNYVEKQQKYDLAAKNDKLKIKILSKEAAQTIKVLQFSFKKAERILCMKKLCDIYRNSKDKIIPTHQDSNISSCEKSQLFWNNVGKVESMLPELKNGIRELLAERNSMKMTLNDLIQIFSKSK